MSLTVRETCYASNVRSTRVGNKMLPHSFMSRVIILFFFVDLTKVYKPNIGNSDRLARFRVVAIYHYRN